MSFCGKKHSEETKEKMRQSKIGKRYLPVDYKHSKETIKKISDSMKISTLNMTEEERSTRFGFWKGKFGSKHPQYLLDRGSLKRDDRRSDSAYQGWRRDVYKRDIWKCKINNQDCNGKIEAHHILSWRDYLELRYDINNGIVLCQSHHPRKRDEEKRLAPEFQRLVSVSSN